MRQNNVSKQLKPFLDGCIFEIELKRRYSDDKFFSYDFSHKISNAMLKCASKCNVNLVIQKELKPHHLAFNSLPQIQKLFYDVPTVSAVSLPVNDLHEGQK